MESIDVYKKMYKKSIDDSDVFLTEQALDLLSWDIPFTKAYDKEKDLFFVDGMLNPCYNVLDRHFNKDPEKNAFICVSNEDEFSYVTYKMLMEKVLQISSFYKKIKLEKGDVVTFYGNNSLDFYACVLACGRLGLVCHFVFGGFNSHTVGERIRDTNTKLIITLDYARRGDKITKYWETVEKAIEEINYENYILIFNNEENIKKNEKIFLFSQLELSSDFIPCVSLNANDDFFIIFTSGSSGKSKGIVHSIAGFLFGTMMTIRLNFGYEGKPGEIYFSTADIGWLACFSHSIYGPLLWGGTSVVFVGMPFYPSYLRIFDIISRSKISHFYTAPTVIRMLQKFMQENNIKIKDIKEKYDLSSLKVLGSVGELLNEEPHNFLKELIGNNIPIINTYWQTETGSIMISPLPIKNSNLKGVGVPTPFVIPKIVKVDPETYEIQDCLPNEKGILLFSYKWPSLAKTLLNDHARYKSTYLEVFPGFYFTGDEAIKDEEGNYFILGRCDDVINISGHRISTLEIESVLSNCVGTCELAVVGIPDDLVGQRVRINVVLNKGILEDDVSAHIRDLLSKHFGKILRNYEIKYFKELPKTQTGKLIRRLLRNEELIKKEVSAYKIH
ncbi:acetly-coenzyme A synthetase (ACSA) [Vairimorpha necatrix]|uniref:acetate--CoA ligase n=1 Tax=Vairimorpha necatrix TaxID=6039 RepID=A0AAX4JAL4_9MICR